MGLPLADLGLNEGFYHEKTLGISGNVTIAIAETDAIAETGAPQWRLASTGRISSKALRLAAGGRRRGRPTSIISPAASGPSADKAKAQRQPRAAAIAPASRMEKLAPKPNTAV